MFSPHVHVADCVDVTQSRIRSRQDHHTLAHTRSRCYLIWSPLNIPPPLEKIFPVDLCILDVWKGHQSSHIDIVVVTVLGIFPPPLDLASTPPPLELLHTLLPVLACRAAERRRGRDCGARRRWGHHPPGSIASASVPFGARSCIGRSHVEEEDAVVPMALDGSKIIGWTDGDCMLMFC